MKDMNGIVRRYGFVKIPIDDLTVHQRVFMDSIYKNAPHVWNIINFDGSRPKTEDDIYVEMNNNNIGYDVIRYEILLLLQYGLIENVPIGFAFENALIDKLFNGELNSYIRDVSYFGYMDKLVSYDTIICQRHRNSKDSFEGYLNMKATGRDYPMWDNKTCYSFIVSIGSLDYFLCLRCYDATFSLGTKLWSANDS